MELLTKEIRDKFKKVGSQEKKEPGEQIVIVKFFDPTGSWTWYATEFDGEDTFFGLVDGFELEWGPFRLSELKSIKGPLGLGIERDLYFGMPMIKDISSIKDRVA
ncbi:hypothetical protein LCGC14_1545210 [marine sediment metagenome]|uniref:DUF2958 domain-containing protein n=1 Tax=marine sediment metagenome TaxID=412755 RepID=A0A0F9IRR9_9ZZZZ